MDEHKIIVSLFRRLERQPWVPFPVARGKLIAPSGLGVYVIRDAKNRVVHVGRAVRGKSGLKQRLGNHLNGASSFVKKHLNGDGSRLRKGYSFRFLEVNDPRQSALLESLAIARFCPLHLGLGEAR
jgi:excinuclease UvrABC nuclease subunit